MNGGTERSVGKIEFGELLEAHRHELLVHCYRLLGSLTEAEDAVQESYARWFAQPVQRRAAVANPAAWLTTVVSRICMDQLRSARMRRERYVVEWIPEPLPARAEWSALSDGSTARDPADHITLDESVEMAFLVVLQRLTPAERAVLLLHDVFDFSHGEIAGLVGKSEPATRKLLERARDAVAVKKRTLAVSRIVLDNFPSVQASWVTQGGKIGQLSLRFGANDFGSLMIEENVVSAAGAHFRLTEGEIARNIQAAGFVPKRRTMHYQIVGDPYCWSHPTPALPAEPAGATSVAG